jgi:acetylornithine deacetylase/succinyl-diaminopimelate desuccinylase-like protein
MADSGLTPQLALRYLGELSADVRAAAILDASGQAAASTEDDPARERRIAGLVRELFERAGEDAAQVEVATPDGAVFAVREGAWAIAAVTGRLTLPSLMFYDLRRVLTDLVTARAA